MSLGASVVSVLSSPIKMVALTAGLGGVVLSAGGVFTVLNAQASNATAQSVATGDLKMTMTATQTGLTKGLGSTNAITGMKPGDTVNRYVELNNTGSIDGKALQMSITGTGVNSAPLINNSDATKNLRIQVDSCSVAWSTDGTCSGDEAVVESQQAITAFSALQATALTGNLPETLYLKVGINLPTVGECSINGAAADKAENCSAAISGESVQGAAAALTFTFQETQVTTGSTINE